MGGVDIFLNNTFSAVSIPHATPPQAVVNSLLQPLKMMMFSMYLPDSAWLAEDLQNLVDHLLSPLLLIGDLNSRSPTLPCHRTNIAGLRTEVLLVKNGLIFIKQARVHILILEVALSCILIFWFVACPAFVAESAPRPLRERPLPSAHNNANP